MDFLVLWHPARSVSEYTSRLMACWNDMLNTMRGPALMYFASLFREASARAVGLAMKRHISLAAKQEAFIFETIIIAKFKRKRSDEFCPAAVLDCPYVFELHS